MKRLINLILLGSFSISLWAVEDATILSLSGSSIEVKEPGGAWEKAVEGQVVSRNSMLATGFNSKAKLSVGGMDLSLSPLTRISIDNLMEEQDTTTTSLSLSTGRLRASSQPAAERKTRRAIDFRVNTPVATAAVRGTEFLLSTNKLETIEGMVELKQGNAVVQAPAGSKSWVAPDAPPTAPIENVGELVTPEIAAAEEAVEETATVSTTGSITITLE